ncbi:hypothetical protein G7019_21850 [Pseudomonas zeshuii]|nr:hypothetical protein [Pseudomonas zeshuii]MBH3440918.1 hypothetical protein [Pseudomonas luteola]
MKSFLLAATLVVVPSVVAMAEDSDQQQPDSAETHADSSQVLGGNAGSACQMILCLSNPSGKELSSCAAPLKRYFDMKPHRRPGFLAQCPRK